MVQENPELRSRIVVVPFSKMSGVGSNVVFRGGAILLPKALVNTKRHASQYSCRGNGSQCQPKPKEIFKRQTFADFLYLIVGE